MTAHYKGHLTLVFAMTTACIVFDVETGTFIQFSRNSGLKLKVSRRPLMAKDYVRFRASESEICGEN